VRRILYSVVALLFAVLGLALHARNHSPVTVDFYAGATELPLSLLLVAALVLGVALGALAMLPGRRRLARRIYRLERDRRTLTSTPPAAKRSTEPVDVP